MFFESYVIIMSFFRFRLMSKEKFSVWREVGMKKFDECSGIVLNVVELIF